MDIQDNWLANFKAVVAAEIAAAGGKEAGGYRAVETNTGLGYDYIYQIYKGKPAHKPKRPSAEAMNTIHRVYGNGRDSSWIGRPVEQDGVKAKEASNIEAAPDFHTARLYPLISDVQAGEWTEICDNFQPGDADVWLPSHFDLGKCGFILRVRGESMRCPHGQYSFPPGVLLHVKPDVEPVPGQFVVVRRNGEHTATFKRLVQLDGVLYLEAINPDWPERYLKLQQGDVFCGTVRTSTNELP